MKKTIILLLALLSVAGIAQAQKEFKLKSPEEGSVSLYGRVGFLDSRENRHSIGEDVIENPPFAVQLQNYVNQLEMASDANKIFVLQLRDLYFFKGKEDGKAVGLCRIRANAYDQQGDDYYFINRIDVVVTAKPKEIYTEAADALGTFIRESISAARMGDFPFTLAEVKDIDIFEKQDIPLFNAPAFADGVYYDYFDFADQKPTPIEMQPKMKDETLKEVKIYDESKKKWQKLSPDNVYAVVIGGQPYIAYDGKFWAGYLSDNNFLFNISYKVNSGNGGFTIGIGMGGGSRHGGMGGGIGYTFGAKKTVTQLMKIDHLNGTAIPAE